MESFSETRLDLGIDYGTRSSLRFSTSIIVDSSGAEQRNANWNQPLGRYQIGDRSVSDSELDYFLDFHAARKGALLGFRFRDWSDYQGKSQLIGTGDGTKTQFQLIKTYTIGDFSAIRPILKPIGGTVKIYSNGTRLNSGWSIDITKGVITFATAPGAGTTITADFEFDVPVRFEQDKIDFRFDAYEVGTGNAIFQLQNLSLVELRIAPTIPISPSLVPASINEVLNLGYDYGTLGGPAYNTTITAVGAGYEKRTSNWDESRGRWQIGDHTLTRAELDYLIAVWRVARGGATGLYYKDWASSRSVPIRFESDSIEFRFDAADLDTKEVLFYLSGIGIIETKLGSNASYNDLDEITSPAGTNICYLVNIPISQSQSINQNFTQAFDANVLTTYSFTVMPPDIVSGWSDVRVYLNNGSWDDCGTVGTFTAPCTLGKTYSYGGTTVLIGTSSSPLSGTVQNLIRGDCRVTLSLTWTGLA